MDLYREEVMDHYEHPRNRGELSGQGVVSEETTNASCGDRVHFYLRINDGFIVEAKWKGGGCAIMTASASKLSEYIVGKKVADLAVLSEAELAQRGVGFEVGTGRLKCLLLPIAAVKKLA
jgi:nitrogen fixation NifU-like protein